MITLIEGRVGSGKSYYAVREILYNYYKWDDEKVQWIPRDDIDVSIYTNIDGFYLAGDLNEAIKKAGGLESFFSDSYQRKFTRMKRHVYVIDEAQKSSLFHKKYYDADVFYVFEYHRHYGLDIFLLTQDIYKLSPGLSGLPEVHIKVQRRSFVLGSGFVYMYMSDRDILKKKRLSKDPRVFRAYRSQRVLQIQKVSSFSKRYAALFILAFISAVGGFVFFLKTFSLRKPSAPKSEQVAIVKDVAVRKKVARVGNKLFYKGSNGLVVGN